MLDFEKLFNYQKLITPKNELKGTCANAYALIMQKKYPEAFELVVEIKQQPKIYDEDYKEKNALDFFNFSNLLERFYLFLNSYYLSDCQEFKIHRKKYSESQKIKYYEKRIEENLEKMRIIFELMWAWRQLSAVLGHGQAAFQLAEFYRANKIFKSVIRPFNEDECKNIVEWYTLAVECRISEAAYQLGILYLKDPATKISIDVIQAEFWLKTAENLGHPGALEARIKLAKEKRAVKKIFVFFKSVPQRLLAGKILNDEQKEYAKLGLNPAVVFRLNQHQLNGRLIGLTAGKSCTQILARILMMLLKLVLIFIG